MCISTTKRAYSNKIKQGSNRPRLQVHRLTRRKQEESARKEMEMENLKLYLQNQTMLEENEKLRKKANVLYQENLALMPEFLKKFPHLNRFTTTFIVFFFSNTNTK